MYFNQETGEVYPPTKDGAIISFKTEQCVYKWINDITFETQGNEVYFAVIDNVGLVHLSGHGSCTLNDGTKKTF